MPFTFAEQTGAAGRAWRGGIGDVTLGVKRALWHRPQRGTIVSAAGEIILPIGDEALGLSKGTVVFEPFVAVGQVLPGEAFLQAQAGIEIPFDRRIAAREAFWRIAAGRSVSQQGWGRTWSPAVEVVAGRELTAGEASLWDVVPQMQVTLSTRQHVMVSGGVRIPVNLRHQRHAELLMYVLWDWFDGPLFGGW